MYTADLAVLVEGDTLWLFTGHDADGDYRGYVMRDWQVFSTTDMKHWPQYPCPLTVNDFKWAISRQAYARHVAKRQWEVLLVRIDQWQRHQCGRE